MKLFLAIVLGASALGLMPERSYAQLPTQLPAGMTPEQALQLLRQNPQLGAALSPRLQASGLTVDQIRAQLTAGGYPANMLDAYLGGGTTGGGTTGGGTT